MPKHAAVVLEITREAQQRRLDLTTKKIHEEILLAAKDGKFDLWPLDLSECQREEFTEFGYDVTELQDGGYAISWWQMPLKRRRTK